MHPRQRVPGGRMRNVTSSSQQACRIYISILRKNRSAPMLLVSSIEILAGVNAIPYGELLSLVSEDPGVLDLGAMRERLPRTTRLGRPASTDVHRGASRTGRRHTPPSRRHGADLCHPRTRPLTLSWTRPIGACESPPIALWGRHRARIKIFDFS